MPNRSILIAVMLMLLSRIASACPEGKDWKSFSSVSIEYGGESGLTLTRFSNGLYARVDDGKSTKEMYQLSNGIYVYNGYDPSKQKGPSPFFMLDMPVGMIIGFLAEHFQQPCSISSASTPFSYARPFGQSTVEVRGSAYRTDESVIVFDLEVLERKERGAHIKASGKVAFSDISPVPPDTSISNWVVTGNGGMGGDSEPGTRIQAVQTIGDLGPPTPQKPKQ